MLPSGHQNFQAELANSGILAAVLTMPESCHWLANVIGTPKLYGILPNSGDNVIVLADASHFERLRRTVPYYVRPAMTFDDTLSALLNGLSGGACKTTKTEVETTFLPLNEVSVYPSRKIGIEMNFMPFNEVNELQGQLPGAELVDIGRLVHAFRLQKEPNEIVNAGLAAQLANVGMKAAIHAVLAGMSEQQQVVAAQSAMMQSWMGLKNVDLAGFGSQEGGVSQGLQVWSLTGERMLLSAAAPTECRPEVGDLVAVLVCAVANGMHAELERTICIGEVSAIARKAIDDEMEIRRTILGMLRPGVAVMTLFLTAIAMMEERGYAGHLPQSIGYSIGRGVREKFSISSDSDVLLKAGQVWTIAPHIYFYTTTDDRGELRKAAFSDTVCIDENGARYLAPFDDAPEIIPGWPRGSQEE